MGRGFESRLRLAPVEIGALLIGNRTFRGDDPHKGVEGKEGKPFGGGWSGPHFVLTHHAPDSPVPGVVTFVGDLDSAVPAATAAAAGDGYVSVLGARTSTITGRVPTASAKSVIAHVRAAGPSVVPRSQDE